MENFIANLVQLQDWFIFEVIIPLLSVPVALFIAYLMDIPRKLSEIIKDGQLCFYCTTTLATLWNNISKPKNTTPFEVTVPSWEYGVIIIFLLLSTAAYVVAVINIQNSTETQINRMQKTSIYITMSVIIIAATIRTLQIQ